MCQLCSAYEGYFATVQKLRDDYAQHDLLIAGIRSIVHTAIVSLIDAAPTCGSQAAPAIREIARIDWCGSDGKATDALARLVTHCARETGDPRVRNACQRADPVRSELDYWPKHRNEVSHGMPARDAVRNAIPKLSELARSLLEAFEPLFEVASESMRAPAHSSLSSVQGNTSTPVLFRRIDFSDPRSPIATVHRLDHEHREETRHVLPETSPLAWANDHSREFRLIEGTHVRLPPRPPELIVRPKLIEEMTEWWNRSDVEGQGVPLLIVGGGGLGKTTLALEFLYQKLVTPSDRYRPSAIVFGSAKETRFGREGLSRIDDVDTARLDDFARLVAKLGALPPEQFAGHSGVRLWKRVASLLARTEACPVARHIVLVIDNSETLIASELEERDQLASTIDGIAKLGFRVIVTSRRRECLKESLTLDVPKLSDAESRKLAKMRASSKSLNGIASAGRALDTALSRLDGNPLLIETFVARAADRPAEKLENIASAISQNRGLRLVEFLYDDAWKRLHEPPQRALFALLRTGPCSEILFGAVCAEAKIALANFELAIAATNWIATPGDSQLNCGIEYHLTDWARDFIDEKYGQLAPKDQRAVDRIVSAAERRVGPEHSNPALARALSAWTARDLDAASAAFDAARALRPKDPLTALRLAEFRVREQRDLGGLVRDAAWCRRLRKSPEGALLVARATALFKETTGPEFETALRGAERAGVGQLERDCVAVEWACNAMHRIAVSLARKRLRASTAADDGETASGGEGSALDEWDYLSSYASRRRAEADHAAGSLQQEIAEMTASGGQEAWRRVGEARRLLVELDARLDALHSSPGTTSDGSLHVRQG